MDGATITDILVSIPKVISASDSADSIRERHHVPQDNTTTDRSGKMLVIGAIGAIVILAGLIAAFAMTAEGVNQSREDLLAALPERTSVASPPASNAQTGSDAPSVRLTLAGDAVEIDFASCRPGQERFDLAGGVATFEVTGTNGSDCIVDYGHNAANPDIVTMACRVPSTTGTQQFLIHDGKPDMSGIVQRCSEI